jgi:hypothetical protein
MIIPDEQAQNKGKIERFFLHSVDQTHKFSNLQEDIRKVERFVQYIENQGSGDITEMEGSEEWYTFIGR